MLGAPGTRVIEVLVPENAPTDQKIKFRAVQARPWMFEGFGVGFDESRILPMNLLSFNITIV